MYVSKLKKVRLGVAALFCVMLMACDSTAVTSAEQRKAKTVSTLIAYNVPVNQALPLIETASETSMRTAHDIAERAVVLYHMAALGYDIDKRRVFKKLEDAGLLDSLTPVERSRLDSAKLQFLDKAELTWHLEAVWTLLWALGKVEQLKFPNEVCDMDALHALMPSPAQTPEFLRNANLRDIESILDETDMAYRTHWAIRDAHLNQRAMPAGLMPNVVIERHRALNWLLHESMHWDDVPTDT